MQIEGRQQLGVALGVSPQQAAVVSELGALALITASLVLPLSASLREKVMDQHFWQLDSFNFLPPTITILTFYLHTEVENELLPFRNV